MDLDDEQIKWITEQVKQGNSFERMLGILAASALDNELSDDILSAINEHVDKGELARAMVMSKNPLTPQRLLFVQGQIKEPFKYDIDDGSNWTDDIVDEYGKYIYNYFYNYKPEAVSLDPTIDPNEQQIGPMAQDIEKVNPSVIVENEQGIKAVDTKKLALMNAGAIGEIARRLKALEDKVK